MVAENVSLAGTPGDAVTGPRIVLIEDDDGDALLVRELLSETGAAVTLRHAGSLAAAKPLLGGANCALLDLGLPDSQGLDGLRWLREHVPGVAVVVLTGLADEHLGEEAVRAGAQDYLVKGQVSGLLLYRVIRYAVERRRAEETQRLLQEARLSAQENSRLERGLLPRPLVSDPRLTVTSRYRPGGARMLLGGDFYDLVEAGDGWLHAMIGDVCGRGPDEAALGVCLRVAWRTMVLAGRPTEEILATLSELLEHERHRDRIFATLCMLSVAPDRAHGRLHLAGHPQPLLIAPTGLAELEASVGPPIGILPVVQWPGGEVTLGPEWTILMYTDGLVEGRAGTGVDRLNSEGLIDLIEAFRGTLPAGEPAGAWPPDRLLDWLLDEVHARNGGPVNDDLAVLAVRCAPARPPRANPSSGAAVGPR
jgi:serine phosphatase RsbU (regulator of sigma subunit)